MHQPTLFILLTSVMSAKYELIHFVYSKYIIIPNSTTQLSKQTIKSSLDIKMKKKYFVIVNL